MNPNHPLRLAAGSHQAGSDQVTHAINQMLTSK